jgi:hypothetical protein
MGLSIALNDNFGWKFRLKRVIIAAVSATFSTMLLDLDQLRAITSIKEATSVA